MCHGNCENCRASNRCFPENEEDKDDISLALDDMRTEEILDPEFWEAYSWWSAIECEEFERNAIA